MFEKTKKENGEKEVERSAYELCRKSKVYEYIQMGEEFFIADMKKKKIYSSADIRLSELAGKLDSDDTFVFKVAEYTM